MRACVRMCARSLAWEREREREREKDRQTDRACSVLVAMMCAYLWSGGWYGWIQEWWSGIYFYVHLQLLETLIPFRIYWIFMDFWLIFNTLFLPPLSIRSYVSSCLEQNYFIVLDDLENTSLSKKKISQWYRHCIRVRTWGNIPYDMYAQ